MEDEIYTMTSTIEGSQGISHAKAGVTFYKHILKVKNPLNEPYPIVRLIGHRGSASTSVQSIARTESDLKSFFLSNTDVFIVTGKNVILSENYCARNKNKKVPPTTKEPPTSNISTTRNSSSHCNGDRMNPELDPSTHPENGKLNPKMNIAKVAGFYLSKLFEKSGSSCYPLVNLIGHRGTASAEIKNVVKNPLQLKVFLQHFPTIFKLSQRAATIADPVFLEISVLKFCFVKCIEEVSFDKLIQSRNEAPDGVQNFFNNVSELKDFLLKYNNIFELRANSVTVKSELITRLIEQSNQLGSMISIVCNEIVSKELKDLNVNLLKHIPPIVARSRMNNEHPSVNSTSFPRPQPDSECVHPSSAALFFMEKLWEHGLCRVVAIKDLFKYRSEASQEIQGVCGNNIQEFKKFLSQYPQSFIVTNENVLVRRNIPRKKWSPALKGVEEPMCSMVLNFFKMYTQNGKPEHIEKLYSSIGKCFTRNDGELLFNTSKDLAAFLDMFPQFFYIFEDHVVNILYHDKNCVQQLSEKRKSKVKSKNGKEYEAESFHSIAKNSNCEMNETIDWKKKVLDKTTYIDSLEQCGGIVSRILKEENVIALDCEGFNLGFDGNLSLIQIAKEDGQVYVFDIHKEPNLIVSGNLKNILESNKIVKVIHDCRNDSVNLYYEYGVLLRRIFDTQIAHSVIKNPKKVKDFPTIGFNKLCEEYGAPINPQKDELKDVYRTNPDFWLKRPLDRDMLAYAALDVACLVPYVYNAMKVKLGDEENDKVFRLSEVYSKSRF